MTFYKRYPVIFVTVLISLLPFIKNSETSAQTRSESPVFIRFKMNEPTAKQLSVNIGGFTHEEPWSFPNVPVNVEGGKWSDWVDLSGWKWHGKKNRSGGVAEYPSIKLSVSVPGSNGKIKGCAFDIELADNPVENSVRISFSEKSASNSIAFLVPYPLKENAKDFETGSQMTARHSLWAKEATGGKPIVLNKFEIITNIWGHYDPNLAGQEVANLILLGFNVIGDVDFSIAKKNGMRIYKHTGNYNADPETTTDIWNKFADENTKKTLATAAGQEEYRSTAHWVIADEVSAVNFQQTDKIKLDNWFRTFLQDQKITEKELGAPINKIEFPLAAMYEKSPPQDASLPERRLFYYAAKFGHWWSAKQLRQTSDLIRGTYPGMKTETLLPSHGFFGNAWGAEFIGMSSRMLDIFEVGRQQSVDQLSAEDWLGLNHMYGSDYTWTGGQSFGYFNAILRSAIGERPLMLRGLITPSDDEYLRLKAYSGLAQGAKSFFFWSFGPTYISTENYWSDLRSEYDGIAKLNRSLEKAEDVLYPAKPVTDPVAILYSVSHDIWNTNHQAGFTEKRLLWHALRHLQVQPDLMREEDIEAGNLKNYKVLYISDWCISRKMSDAIDKWVKDGGVLYLSAGAATRDEFYEPYSPPFAEKIWGKNAAQRFVTQDHIYNERSDLPNIKPMTFVNVELKNQNFNLPVIGSRLDISEDSANQFAAFSDGKTAGKIITYGHGKIIGLGFMPMLAYGQLAGFKPQTLEEKWSPEPRLLVQMALDEAKITPSAKADVPVVETSLLTGKNGSAIVLANYTYQPIKSLTIDVKLLEPVKKVVSVEGENIQMTQLSSGQLRLKLPLKWTDIILLQK